MTENAERSQQQEDLVKSFTVEDMSPYRDGYRNLMRLVMAQAVLMVLICAFDLYYIHTYVPRDSYYAVSPGGTKRTLYGLDLPNANTEAMERWTAAAVTEIMTFGFNDIDERFTAAQRLFSPEGWVSFSTALFASRSLKSIMSEQQMITAIPASRPSLLAEGMVTPGEYGWIMSVPMNLTIRAGGNKHNSRSIVRIVIVRMPTATNPMGLGIRTFIAS